MADEASAQVIDPFYSTNYSYTDLASVPKLPPIYGGLTFKYDDPNTIIIGGNANTADGNLYTIGVTRDGNGHVTGFRDRHLSTQRASTTTADLPMARIMYSSRLAGPSTNLANTFRAAPRRTRSST